MALGARGHRQLRVWEQSVELAVRIDEFTEVLVGRRKFAMADQLSRAAISVPSNIAEGGARGSRPDYRRFVRISLGSLAELDTQLEICLRRRYLKPETHAWFLDQIAQVTRQLVALWTRLGGTRQGLSRPQPQDPRPET